MEGSTGRSPSVTYSNTSCQYEGPFVDFANDALLALRPHVASIDGILKRIASTYGRDSRDLT